jgi:acyl-CoA thioesterase I
MHPSLRPLIDKFQSGQPATLIAFGDSITFGSQIDPARDESMVYHKQWHDRMRERYPRLNLTIVNRGVPGHKITDAHARVQSEVIDKQPDAAIVAFGINDCWDGLEKAEQFERELERLVARIRHACGASPILMTTNMLNFRSSDAARRLAWFADQTAAAQNAGWTDEYMQRVRDVSARVDVPLADGYAKWQQARHAGIDTDTLLVNLANHPNRQGHELLADALFEVFDE